MLINSYNQKYNVQYKAYAVNSCGYKVMKNNDVTWKTWYPGILGTSDSLYVIESKSDAIAMWLASPSAEGDNIVAYIDYSGSVGFAGYGGNQLGFRPLVCLNSKVVLQEENGEYTIK